MSAEAPHPGAVLGLLADQARLRALAAVVLGARSLGEVAAAAGLGPRQAERAVAALVNGALVETGPQGEFRLVPTTLSDVARRAARMRPEITPEDLGAAPEQAAVLRNFLRDGRLTTIPAARGKRRVVLDFLAGRFEPGRVYSERDVNRVLGRFHADFAALRRYLVDEEFLERREGFYWRAGGTFEVE